MRNNPLSRVDPSGYDDEPIEEVRVREERIRIPGLGFDRYNTTAPSATYTNYIDAYYFMQSLYSNTGSYGMGMDMDITLRPMEYDSSGSGGYQPSQEGQEETRVDYSTWNVSVSFRRIFSIDFELNNDRYGKTYFGLGLSLGPSLFPVTISRTEGRLAFWDRVPNEEILEGHLAGGEIQALLGAGPAIGYSIPFTGGDSLVPDHFIWESGYSMPTLSMGANYSWNISDMLK